EDITRIGVAGQCVRNEAVVPRIAHRRVEEAVDHKRARGLVHFVFDRLAPDRHLDDHIDVVGRVPAAGDCFDAPGVARWWVRPLAYHPGTGGARTTWSL